MSPKNAPLPDRIVCNGSFYRDILIREGLVAERLRLSLALRYSYLNVWKKEQNQDTIDILVTTSLIDSDAHELLAKGGRGF